MNQLRLCLEQETDLKLGLCLITEGDFRGHVVLYGSIDETTGMAVCYLPVPEGSPPSPILVEHQHLMNIEEENHGTTKQNCQ